MNENALKYVQNKIADLENDLQHYTMVEHDKCKEFYIREDLKKFKEILECLEYLKDLENTKPNEAIHKLESIKNQLFEYFKDSEVRDNDIEGYEKLIFEPVKQYILKAQENEKVLKIIKEKLWFDNHNFGLFNMCDLYRRYYAQAISENVKKSNILTEEEFESIKRYLNDR